MNTLVTNAIMAMAGPIGRYDSTLLQRDLKTLTQWPGTTRHVVTTRAVLECALGENVTLGVRAIHWIGMLSNDERRLFHAVALYEATRSSAARDRLKKRYYDIFELAADPVFSEYWRRLDKWQPTLSDLMRVWRVDSPKLCPDEDNLAVLGACARLQGDPVDDQAMDHILADLLNLATGRHGLLERVVYATANFGGPRSLQILAENFRIFSESLIKMMLEDGDSSRVELPRTIDRSTCDWAGAVEILGQRIQELDCEQRQMLLKKGDYVHTFRVSQLMPHFARSAADSKEQQKAFGVWFGWWDSAVAKKGHYKFPTPTSAETFAAKSVETYRSLPWKTKEVGLRLAATRELLSPVTCLNLFDLLVPKDEKRARQLFTGLVRSGKAMATFVHDYYGKYGEASLPEIQEWLNRQRTPEYEMEAGSYGNQAGQSAERLIREIILPHQLSADSLLGYDDQRKLLMELSYELRLTDVRFLRQCLDNTESRGEIWNREQWSTVLVEALPQNLWLLWSLFLIRGKDDQWLAANLLPLCRSNPETVGLAVLKIAIGSGKSGNTTVRELAQKFLLKGERWQQWSTEKLLKTVRPSVREISPNFERAPLLIRFLPAQEAVSVVMDRLTKVVGGYHINLPDVRTFAPIFKAVAATGRMREYLLQNSERIEVASFAAWVAALGLKHEPAFQRRVQEILTHSSNGEKQTDVLRLLA